MKREKSCGAVVFTNDGGSIKYVIIRSKGGVYGFPKGHVEDGESETQTALREILEETGLRVSLVPDFRAEDVFNFTHNGKSISKQVVYFLAKYSSQTLLAQKKEIKSIELMDYDSAINIFQFESTKGVLKKAHDFLSKLETI